MALAGYPQTHHSPDIEIVTTQHDTNQYEGPFSSIKVMSDATTEYAHLILYLDKAGFDSNTTEGTDYFVVRAMATDTIPGPIYGFVLHTSTSTGVTVAASRYSTSIL